MDQLPNAEYLALDNYDAERLASYRGLFKHQFSEALLADVRRVVNQGLVLGNERLKEEAASILERNIPSRSVGRSSKK